MEHPPRRGTRFGAGDGAGDNAYLVGPYEELPAVLRRDALTPNEAGRATDQRESASCGNEIP
ncbi:MAG: hypothetical protein ABS81_32100 [Pseudonocardia sp. SCN 72-86]|nr:MAG: hypothetical protein ABS81_32100 [Pseudonocardia sp. SCN 72-86]